MAVRGVGTQGFFMANARYADDLLGQQFVGLVLDPLGDIAVSRAAVGRVVLEATALRRVVRRGNDDAVSQPGRAATVVTDDRVGHRRRWRVLVTFGDHHLYAIGSQHFKRGGSGWRGQRVGVGPQKQRAVDAVGLAI